MLQPDILAKIKFYTTAEGGRESPIIRTIGYLFKFENELFDCRLIILEGIIILPGETKNVPIKFLCPNLIKNRLTYGSQFHLKGFKTIAEGTVIKVY